MSQPVVAQKDRLSWDVVLFFALYTVLLTYFTVEFNTSLPLITASWLLLVLLGFVIRSRKLLFRFKKPNLTLTEDKFLSRGLLIYFGLIVRQPVPLCKQTGGFLCKIL